MAAGLGIAKAISSKQDLLVKLCQVQSSKSCSFKNSKRESTNDNDKMLAENNAKKTKTLYMSDDNYHYEFHILVNRMNSNNKAYLSSE